MGLQLDDASVRICVALRLGLPVCAPHDCKHCGASVCSLGLHGLSCKRGSLRFHRHVALNDVIHRSLSYAGIPACLEPSGLLRSDGKRPDDLTLVHWECGRPMVWDVTVPESIWLLPTGQQLYLVLALAALAEAKKSSKYAHLSISFSFFPVAIESLGALSPISHSVIKSLGQSKDSLRNGLETPGLYGIYASFDLVIL